MVTTLLKPFLTRAASVPERVPDDVGVFRNRLIPTLVGLLSGMGEAASAVTVGDAIIVHPETPLTARLVRHELQHVRQWRAHPLLFPVRYAWNQLRHGYERNPYEVDARSAERQP